jgi:hypothetical protein
MSVAEVHPPIFPEAEQLYIARDSRYHLAGRNPAKEVLGNPHKQAIVPRGHSVEQPTSDEPRYGESRELSIPRSSWIY